MFHIEKTVEFGDGSTIEPRTVVTAATVLDQTNAIYFEFTVDEELRRIETIYQYALEEKIEQGYMSYK